MIDPAHYHDRVSYEQALRRAGLEVFVPSETRGGCDTGADIVDDPKSLIAIDLIITEHFMNTPDRWDDKLCESGTRVAREVIRRVRVTHPELPIIILTCMRDDGERRRNQQLSNVYFCQKRKTTPDQLVEIVRDILGLAE
ncbi:MAG: hypothetical protein V1716_00885 [Candidatus Uhrbacteria bacterium]